MLKQLLEIKKSERKWHFPVIAGLSIGIPLLGGYYTGNMQGGNLASLGGLVILYVHSLSIINTMTTLMTCSFGIMLSFSIGLLFGFNPWVASLVLGIFAFVVHQALYYLKLTRPPGSMFFILIASLAICMPYNLKIIPEKLGYVGIGCMIACILALLYSIVILKKSGQPGTIVTATVGKPVRIIESVTFGLVIGAALLVAHLLKLQNPYWVPTTCVAVMQGSTTSHVWLRSMQRTIGTFVGMGLTWLILLLQPGLLVIYLSIIVLQVIVEWLVVRNYAIAVVFITALSILLSESSKSLMVNPSLLMEARFVDILLGSIIGSLGGWLLYNERLHTLAIEKFKKTKPPY